MIYLLNPEQSIQWVLVTCRQEYAGPDYFRQDRNVPDRMKMINQKNFATRFSFNLSLICVLACEFHSKFSFVLFLTINA